MSRVLALIVAVGMVVGALVLRDRIETRVQASTDEEEIPRGTLTCVEELREACELVAADGPGAAFELRVEAAGDTVAALAQDAAAAGLWLVPAPWVGVAQADLDPASQVEPQVSEVLARSPLVLTGFVERLDALAEVCGDAVTWRCIGERAGTPWRELGLEDAGSAALRPGHLNPTRSSVGLLVLGHAATSFAQRTDLNRGDLDADAFSTWFVRLESAIPEFDPASGSQVTDMLTRGPASYDVVGSTEAESRRLIEAAPQGPRPIEFRVDEPVATADLVLAAFGGEDVDAALRTLGDPLREALSECGWRVGSEPVADGPPLPEDAGLPSAGFLVALQERWEEVAR